MVFWVYPFLLNPAAPSGTKSYFLNAFNRVQVYVDNPPSGQLTENVHFAFTIGPAATDIVEPVYVPANQAIQTNAWNYVSISFRIIPGAGG